MTDYKYKNWVLTIQETINTPELPNPLLINKVLGENCEKWIFQQEKGDSERKHYQCAIISSIRIRHDTLLKRIAASLDITEDAITLEQMRGSWIQNVAYCSKPETRVGETYTSDPRYNGSDIDFLHDKDQRYPWQDKIISRIVDEATAVLKTADDRSILWIEDTKGGNGKSKLIKWMCHTYPNIIKLSFGTANQLRSAIISAGAKSAYFIDVPRTLGDEDSMRSLMSALEDLKNGFVCSNMYGKYEHLFLDPPHVVIVSNKECETKYLSEDRWEIYMIDQKRDLFHINENPVYLSSLNTDDPM
jgi:hypothetical protein